MSIFLMLNLKGGVAKTTNTVAVAEALADSGFRTLVVDADHQCMASELLIGENALLQAEKRTRTLHDLFAAMLDDDFEEEHVAPYVVQQVSNIGEGYPNLDLIPCSIRIDDFQSNMAKARRGFREYEEFNRILSKRRGALKRFLSANYDYVVVDCPPSIPQQVTQLIRVADAFVIPSVPDRLSVRGSLWLLDRLRRKNLTRIKGVGTLWSLYREQTAVHRFVVDEANKRTPPFDRLPRPFKTIIPNASKIAESTEPDLNPHTFNAKYSTKFARLYRELSREIRLRLNRLNAHS